MQRLEIIQYVSGTLVRHGCTQPAVARSTRAMVNWLRQCLLKLRRRCRKKRRPVCACTGTTTARRVVSRDHVKRRR